MKGLKMALAARREMCYTEGGSGRNGNLTGGENMFRRKKRAAVSFDKSGKIPVIRSSICTGEQTAGFQDQETGRIQEVMLIRGEADLREFVEEYGLEEAEIKHVW